MANALTLSDTEVSTVAVDSGWTRSVVENFSQPRRLIPSYRALQGAEERVGMAHIGLLIVFFVAYVSRDSERLAN